MRHEIDPSQTMMQRARNVVAEYPVAAYGAAFLLAIGGASAKNVIDAPVAKADVNMLPPNPNDPNRCEIGGFPTQPCDVGVDPAGFDNSEVISCQSVAIGDPKNPKDNGMIFDRKIQYKLGSKKVTVTEKISKLEFWSIYSYFYSCDSVTDNSVDQRMVVAVKPSKKSAKTSYKAYKSLPKRTTVRADKTTAFDPKNFGPDGGSTIRKSTFTMSRKLTKQDVKKHRVCLSETINSKPLIQKPHIDPMGRPDFTVPGPMTTQKRTIVDCVRSSQVAKASKKKK